MYKNTSYDDNKYYYAYIENLEYVNDEMTRFNLKLDVFQTWQFDFIYKKSFIERKHVTNDSVGANTLPESVELGEYIVDDYQNDSAINDYCYLLNVTQWADGSYPKYCNLGGIPINGGIYVCRDYNDLCTIVDLYNHGGSGTQQVSAEAIEGAYMIPRAIINHDFEANPYHHQFQGQTLPNTHYVYINKPSSLNGYVPKNNKLFTYPYCYLLLSNNMGSSNVLHYEKFTSNDCEFLVSGIPTAGGSIKCCPTDYAKAGSILEEEGIIAGKFPLLSWGKNEYQDWLLTNSSTLAEQKGAGVVEGGLGVASTLIGLAMMGLSGVTGQFGLGIAGLGMTLGGTSTIFNGSNEVYRAIATQKGHSLVAPSSQGLSNSGDIATANHTNNFYFYCYSIKQEYAKIIDDYFSMFGYKVNSSEVPNLHTRSNWNFLKVIDVNVESNVIPDSDLNEYKQMLQHGITFWHNYSTFRDYSQTNSIIV